MLAQRNRRLGHVRREHLLRGAPAERSAPRDQLVAQYAEGVDVHPLVDVGLAGGLFRRHVGRRAEGDTYAVVSAWRPVASLTALATPKSVTSAWRPESRIFSGLMSRCTTFWEWA